MIGQSDGPKSSDFGQNPTTRPIDAAHRILGSKNGIRILLRKTITEQSLGYTACCNRSKSYIQQTVRVPIDALNYEYNHGARTQSLRFFADRLVGRRGLEPRDQKEQRTQGASFVATYHTRVRSQRQSSCWARMPREAPGQIFSRPDCHEQSAQARVLESGAERHALGVSLRGARHSTIVDVGLMIFCPNTNY